MKHCKVLLLFVLIVAAGCRQKAEPPAAADPVPVAATDEAGTAGQAVAPEQTPPPPTYIAAQAQNTVQAGAEGPVDEFLTSQLRIFLRDKGRLPQSFTEFAATRLDSVPHAPTGSKWVIDSATQEVKAVAK